MKYTKSIFGLIITAIIFISCENSNIEDIENQDVITTELSNELNQEDLNSMIENITVKYPITATNDDESEETITSDEELKAYGKKSNRPKINFPIDIEINGETITINTPKDLKKFFIKPTKKRPPFRLVFPVTVINADESTVEILDVEAFKTYRETLEEGTKPTFQFPISIEKKDGTIIEIINQDALKEYIEENKPNRKGNKKTKIRKPPFKLVFPVTVINTDDSTTEIIDVEAMKSYRETLEKDTKPTFQFPISIEDKDENTIEIADENALKEYITANKPIQKKRK